MNLKMNFRGIFLAKCLVVLFSCVKGSANEPCNEYGMQNGSVFLNIHDFKVDQQQEVTWLKDSLRLTKGKGSDVKYNKDKKKYEMFPSGTLKINHLMEEDSGNYKVTVYNVMGSLQVEKNLNLCVQEMVSKPEIKWTCTQKLINVTCEVKQKNKYTFNLLQNNATLHVRTTAANGIWKIEYRPNTKILTGKFQCKVENDISQNTTDQEIKCSGPLDIVLIGSIAGGAIVFVIFLALLIYCIRKKRAERYEEEQDEETPMKIRQSSDESKYRELPKPPVHGPPKQPRQQQRPPPPSQTQYQAGPPRPRPRTQQKSPSHMKERP
ncbi:T-cell surface antigen CD2 isoform X1 [Mauremys reevesii]|uniref:T-cell surface antigen CD2 isoform X1 n=2 Tax=Mauremys reevesii TaxID=260615 RepID=UPI00193FECC1|nr:T-cell surface antigen CD2 isoform X1 [Mauremys reevesii]